MFSGGKSQLDIIQSSFQKSVAEGRMTVEEVANIMKKMGISSETEVRSTTISKSRT